MQQYPWPGYAIYDASLENDGLLAVAPTIEQIRRLALGSWGVPGDQFIVSMTVLPCPITQQSPDYDISWL